MNYVKHIENIRLEAKPSVAWNWALEQLRRRGKEAALCQFPPIFSYNVLDCFVLPCWRSSSQGLPSWWSTRGCFMLQSCLCPWKPHFSRTSFNLCPASLWEGREQTADKCHCWPSATYTCFYTGAQGLSSSWKLCPLGVTCRCRNINALSEKC